MIIYVEDYGSQCLLQLEGLTSLQHSALGNGIRNQAFLAPRRNDNIMVWGPNALGEF